MFRSCVLETVICKQFFCNLKIVSRNISEIQYRSFKPHFLVTPPVHFTSDINKLPNSQNLDLPFKTQVLIKLVANCAFFKKYYYFKKPLCSSIIFFVFLQEYQKKKLGTMRCCIHTASNTEQKEVLTMVTTWTKLAEL